MNKATWKLRYRTARIIYRYQWLGEYHPFQTNRLKGLYVALQEPLRSLDARIKPDPLSRLHNQIQWKLQFGSNDPF